MSRGAENNLNRFYMPLDKDFVIAFSEEHLRKLYKDQIYL